MLYQINNLLGRQVSAIDGKIGKVDDFYFDDHSWTIRYLVVDIGSWFTSKKVVIAPEAAGATGWGPGEMLVNLTKAQIEESPSIDLEKTVSRQQKLAAGNKNQWSIFKILACGASRTVGVLSTALLAVEAPTFAEQKRRAQQGKIEKDVAESNSNLRSAKEVVSYNIGALDDEVGSIEDFYLDDAAWRIRYVLINTRNWLLRKKVLVWPKWIERISWKEQKVHVALSRANIEKTPAYDPGFW